MDDVGLEDADLAVFQQRLEVMLGGAALAGRKARLDAAADLGEGCDVSASQGSSASQRQGSARARSRSADAGLQRPWQPTTISISGPTASRTASTSWTARRIAGYSGSRRALPNGSNFRPGYRSLELAGPGRDLGEIAPAPYQALA